MRKKAKFWDEKSQDYEGEKNGRIPEKIKNNEKKVRLIKKPHRLLRLKLELWGKKTEFFGFQNPNFFFFKEKIVIVSKKNKYFFPVALILFHTKSNPTKIHNF